MPKALCIIGMVIAGLLLIVLGLDIGAKIPFNGVSLPIDVGMIVAAVVLIYASWATFRQLK